LHHEAGVAVDGFTPIVAEVQNAVRARVLQAFKKKSAAAGVTECVKAGVRLQVRKKREKLRRVLDELGSVIARVRARTPLEEAP
jgi:hypothetical protein